MAVLTFPLSCWVGLAVAGAEVAVAGYVRQAVTLDYCVDGVTLSNTASLQWQHATQSWGSITTVQIWDSASGGTLLGSVPPNAQSVLIDMYDIARIPASGFSLAYVKVARPYGVRSFGTGPFGTYRVFQAASFTIRPYGSGLFGTNIYGALAAGCDLQRDFDQQHVCAPGTWAPGPFSMAA